MVAGRPNKYGEKCITLNFNLPESVVEYITNISEEHNLSKTELVINAIQMSNRDQLIRITQEHNNLKKAYSDVNKTNRTLTEKLDEIKDIKLYKEVNEDPNLKEFFSFLIHKYKSNIFNFINEDKFIYDKYEQWLFATKHQIVKNKHIIKMSIKTWTNNVISKNKEKSVTIQRSIK